ncbi:MAG: hypothetical protein AB7Y46_03180 [Armatimonadota bacterium]
MSRSQASARSGRRTWSSRADFEQCTRTVGVDNSTRGVRLARSALLQDERGCTQPGNRQELSDEVRALKEFMLEPADIVGGRLYVYGSPAFAALNGKRLKPIRTLPSTGWSVLRVPAAVMRAGINRFTFWGGGTLLVEESLYPNRSALSLDGGVTWDYDAMGPQGMNNGEFVARLRLQRYPREAAISSPPIDLAELGAEDGVLPRLEAVRARLRWRTDEPTGSCVRREARTSPDLRRWSPWADAERICSQQSLPRFLQWRATLCSEDGRTTPVLREVVLEADVQVASPAPAVRVMQRTDPPGPAGSFRFAYQQPTDRLRRLRDQYALDEVVSGCSSEMEAFVALRDWCRHSAPRGWDMGRSDWCPPWDALVILETNRDLRALCMCTHYSTLLVETAAALGYVGRHVILDHHCVAELWCNDLRKWVLMDTGNSADPERNCHFEHNGVPLNALEIRRLWQQGRTDEVRVIYPRRRPIRGGQITPDKQCDFPNYRRFGIPLRNNFLDTPFPGELTQGRGEYFCDVYLWWEDGPVPMQSPEYGLTSSRPADFYWPLNETAVSLLATDRPDVVAVELRTSTPNFEAFSVRTGDGPWREVGDRLQWRLPAGRAILEARSRNCFGVQGPATRLVLDHARPARGPGRRQPRG